MYIASNAIHYKYFEHWAFGKGIEISHVLNSGRSIGDARVDCSTALLALAAAAKQHPGRDVLILAADAAPANPGAEFGNVLVNLSGGPSKVLLIPNSSNRAGGDDIGPRISVTVNQSDDADLVVSNVVSSTDTDSRSLLHKTGTFSCPIAYYLNSKDVQSLLSNGIESLASIAPQTLSSTGAAGERIIPIETMLQWLATRSEGSKVHGVKLPLNSFVVGAFDGRPHRVPSGAASPGAESPYAHRLPLQLVPGLSLLSNGSAKSSSSSSVIHTRAYARVGLLGNPSDGYGGKTLAVTIANFFAEAWLTPAPKGAGITLIPHPISDPLHFSNLSHLSTLAGREGYSGGIRLMMAALHRFRKHCANKGVVLPPESGFFVRYHTSVPRQVGLAGSSAIVTAFLRAVMAFYGFGDEESASKIGLNKELLPNFVLAIEYEELGITAGLQDRVVQAYEGAVHMDFSNPEKMKAAGGAGTYERVPVSSLPPLFLAYAPDPSDSGKIHAPVKQRWLAGDVEVVEGMKLIASMADKGLDLTRNKPYSKGESEVTFRENSVRAREEVVQEWARLMRTNFDTRRKLFGDGALGKDNIRMIEIARECGSSGKFPGSGGAILGVVDAAGIAATLQANGVAGFPELCAQDALDFDQKKCADARVAAATNILRAAYHREGYVFVRLEPHERRQ